MLAWVVCGALIAGLGYGYLHERATRKQCGLIVPWPIRSISVEELDPIFWRNALGPTLETEVHFVGGADAMPVPGATSDVEAWILAVLGKHASLCFEFGTCTGRTAYLWARNSPPGARVVTLTLSPNDIGAYRREAGDSANASRIAVSESAFETFYYSGTPIAGKVTQLFGDSKAFDPAPFEGQCDLVFVDGSHARSYVASDSRAALRLVKPGGLVLWHDYRGHKLKGVSKTLNALSRELPLFHIRGTSLVAYRRPAPGA